MSIIKQTKPAKYMTHLCFHTYNKDPKLRAASHPAEYLKEQKAIRTHKSYFQLVLNLVGHPVRMIYLAGINPLLRRVVQVITTTYLIYLELQLHSM